MDYRVEPALEGLPPLAHSTIVHVCGGPPASLALSGPAADALSLPTGVRLLERLPELRVSLLDEFGNPAKAPEDLHGGVTLEVAGSGAGIVEVECGEVAREGADLVVEWIVLRAVAGAEDPLRELIGGGKGGRAAGLVLR